MSQKSEKNAPRRIAVSVTKALILVASICSSNAFANVPGFEIFPASSSSSTKSLPNNLSEMRFQMTPATESVVALGEITALLDPANFAFQAHDALAVLARTRLMIPVAFSLEAPNTVTRGFFRYRQFLPPLHLSLLEQNETPDILNATYLPKQYVANRLMAPVIREHTAVASATPVPQPQTFPQFIKTTSVKDTALGNTKIFVPTAVKTVKPQAVKPTPVVAKLPTSNDILNEIRNNQKTLKQTQNDLRKVVAANGIDFDSARERLLGKAGNIPLPLNNPRIVVYKSKRKLDLFDGNKLIKSYKMGSGQKPGKKEKQGDMKTPEGTYHLVNRNPSQKFHLFMGLNYPNASDAQNGLQKKIISTDTAASIIAAERSQRLPSWGTRLGGAVGIHGAGGGANWTAGCIALNNPEIEELWLATKNWTPVEIKQ